MHAPRAAETHWTTAGTRAVPPSPRRRAVSAGHRRPARAAVRTPPSVSAPVQAPAAPDGCRAGMPGAASAGTRRLLPCPPAAGPGAVRRGWRSRPRVAAGSSPAAAPAPPPAATTAAIRPRAACTAAANTACGESALDDQVGGEQRQARIVQQAPQHRGRDRERQVRHHPERARRQRRRQPVRLDHGDAAVASGTCAAAAARAAGRTRSRSRGRLARPGARSACRCRRRSRPRGRRQRCLRRRPARPRGGCVGGVARY